MLVGRRRESTRQVVRNTVAHVLMLRDIHICSFPFLEDDLGGLACFGFASLRSDLVLFWSDALDDDRNTLESKPEIESELLDRFRCFGSLDRLVVSNASPFNAVGVVDHPSS